MHGLTTITLTVGMLLVAGGFVWQLSRSFLHTCRPNELLVFSGRRVYIDAAGQERSFAVIGPGERYFHLPVVEKADRMDLGIIPLRVNLSRVESKCGNRISVHVAASVRVSSHPLRRHRAVERFLDKTPEEIGAVAHSLVEAALSEVVVLMTAEALRKDRLRFRQHFVEAARENFFQMGLALESVEVL